MLHEALSILEDDDVVEPQQVCIEPPDLLFFLTRIQLTRTKEVLLIISLGVSSLGARCEVMLAGKSKDHVRRLTTSKTVKSYSEPQLGPSGNQTSRNRGRGLSQHRSGGRCRGRSHNPDSDSTTGVITNRRKKGNTDKSSKPIFYDTKIYLKAAVVQLLLKHP
ncbi:hypothetical protein EVAR_102038_1 [Eumeta japonica]|uniref:Uncharacterized protein n=1 Tax=Eumeta variegata TaxID=151549 RepID=A0A4C1TZH7_EUMVA|nr:hypothetical protein EVAR_102038_1 [Eumeta japonica]